MKTYDFEAVGFRLMGRKPDDGEIRFIKQLFEGAGVNYRKQHFDFTESTILPEYKPVVEYMGEYEGKVEGAAQELFFLVNRLFGKTAVYYCGESGAQRIDRAEAAYLPNEKTETAKIIVAETSYNEEYNMVRDRYVYDIVRFECEEEAALRGVEASWELPADGEMRPHGAAFKALCEDLAAKLYGLCADDELYPTYKEDLEEAARECGIEPQWDYFGEYEPETVEFYDVCCDVIDRHGGLAGMGAKRLSEEISLREPSRDFVDSVTKRCAELGCTELCSIILEAFKGGQAQDLRI